LALAACASSDDGTTTTTAKATTSTAAPAGSSTTAAPATTDPGGVPALGPGALGRIRVGQTQEELEATGQVGPVGPGCEAAGPNAEAADLKVPGTTPDQLTGAVQLDEDVVSGITISQGRTVDGVTIDMKIDEATAILDDAGYTLEPDDGTGEMFGVVIAQFTKDGTPVYGLVAETFSKKVTSISTPAVTICE
ncbi:MAG: hypothetical protein ACKO04_15975, partial [Actinomycetes bacterium]